MTATITFVVISSRRSMYFNMGRVAGSEMVCYVLNLFLSPPPARACVCAGVCGILTFGLRFALRVQQL